MTAVVPSQKILRCWLLPALLLALCSVPLQPAHGQPVTQQAQKSAPHSIPADAAAAPRLRRPDEARLRELRSQRDFRYVEVKSEQGDLSAFFAPFWRWLADILDTPAGNFTWKYGFYAVLVAALVFAVLKIMQVDLTRAFGRAPRQAPLSFDTETEDLHALDLDKLLAQAETEHSYRLAVRLGYLQVLRQLSDKSLIRWQPDKTNHDYLYELPAGPLPEAFRELTRQFEYVWYGEQDDLTADDYERVRATRQAFQRRLTSSRQAA
ncbi:DUF4129 domain-containing protein [Hymenobacter rigui]|uniref:DUF4129 domain-containing protein n=1 Tax=Hymenobacter rigui TaxID=334424 RepID=A0A3R9P0U1_9BACT|nr:DUF4129 domain-containing protein [Hymenobacter rigui]RSK47736.1 DUF4129 domain-containing protein [Hymenobacter rigui]